MREVVDRLRPFLPPDTDVKIRSGPLLMTLTATSNRLGSGSVSDGSLGRTISPWLPKHAAARVAAREAVERVLAAVFPRLECSIKTAVVDQAVHVSFQLPEDIGSEVRTELDPLPIDLCF